MEQPTIGRVKYGRGKKKFWRWSVLGPGDRHYAASNVRGNQTIIGARLEARQAAEIMAAYCLELGLPAPDQPWWDRWLRQLGVWLLRRQAR